MVRELGCAWQVAAMRARASFLHAASGHANDRQRCAHRSAWRSTYGVQRICGDPGCTCVSLVWVRPWTTLWFHSQTASWCSCAEDLGLSATVACAIRVLTWCVQLAIAAVMVITADVWQDLGSPTVGGGDDMRAFFKAGRLHIPCGNGQSVALPAMPGLTEH